MLFINMIIAIACRAKDKGIYLEMVVFMYVMKYVYQDDHLANYKYLDQVTTMNCANIIMS